MSFSQVDNPHRFSSKKKTRKKKKKKKKSMTGDLDSSGSDSSSSSSSSSASSSSSSDDGGYEPDDPRIDKRKEPLRPGDVIRYQLPIFTAGTEQGINQAVVIETDPYNSKSSVKLSSHDYLPNDTYVQRIQEYKDKTLYPHRGGCLKPLTRFKMKKRSLSDDELTTILSSYNKNRRRRHGGTLTDRAQKFKDVCNELEKTAVEYLAGKHDDDNFSNDKVKATNDNMKSKSKRHHTSSRKSKPDGESSAGNNSPSRTQTSSQVTSDSASLSSSSSSSDDDHECRQKSNGAAPLKLRRHHSDHNRRLNLGPSSKTTSSRRVPEDRNERVDNKNNNIEEIANALLGLSRSSTTTSSGTSRTSAAAATSTADTSAKRNNKNLNTDTLLPTKTSPRKAFSVKDNANKPNISVGQPTNDNKHHTGKLMLSSSDSSDGSDDNSDDSMSLQLGRPKRSDDRQDISVRQTASPASKSHIRSGMYTAKRTSQKVSSELPKKTSSLLSSSNFRPEIDEHIDRGRHNTASVASVESLNDASKCMKNHPLPRKELETPNADPTKNSVAAESTSTKTGMFSLSKLNCNGKNSGNKRLDVEPSPGSSTRPASSKSLRRRRSSGVMKQIQETYQPLQIELKPGFAAAYERLEERKRMRALRHEERLAAEDAKSSSKKMKTDRNTYIRKMKNSKKKDSKISQRSRDLPESSPSSPDSLFSNRRNPDRRGRPLSLLPNTNHLRTTTDETSEEEFDWSPSDDETKLSIKRDKSPCLEDNDDGDDDVLILGKPRDNQSRSNTSMKLSLLSTAFSDNEAENGDDEDESDDLSDTGSRPPIARKRSLEKKQPKRKSIDTDEILVQSQSPPKMRKKKETDVKTRFSSKVLQMSRTGMRTKKKKKTSAKARSRHRITGLSADREEASQLDHRTTSETKASVQGKTIQLMDTKKSRQLDINKHDRLDGDCSSTTSTTSKDDIEILTPPPQRKVRRSSSEKNPIVGKSFPSSGEKSVFDFDGKDDNDIFDSIKKRQISLSLKRRGSGKKRG